MTIKSTHPQIGNLVKMTGYGKFENDKRGLGIVISSDRDSITVYWLNGYWASSPAARKYWSCDLTVISR